MNCPRCKHGSFPIADGFCCGNCRATFLVEGSAVTSEPLVRESAVAGRYEVRRRAGLDIRVLMSGLAFVVGIVVLMSRRVSETADWATGVLLGAAALATCGIL